MSWFLFQDPTLSKPQSFYRKEIYLPFTFSYCSRPLGREGGTRWAGPRSLVFGRGAESQVISSPHSGRVPLQSPPRRPPAPLRRTSNGGFRTTEGHTAPTTSGPRYFRPCPAELQAPTAPAQGPPPPTSAQNESQNPPRDARPRNRTKPAEGGGGKGEGRGGHRGWRTLRWY